MPKDFPAVIAAIIVCLGLAGALMYISVRLSSRRSDITLVMGLLMLALVFGIVAIFAVTFLGKTRSG